MFLRSPVDNEYIPGTILNKAIAPHSYFIEAQGKRYHRIREHLWPIHPNLSPLHNINYLHNPNTKYTFPTFPSQTLSANTFPQTLHYQDLLYTPMSYPIHPRPQHLPIQLLHPLPSETSFDTCLPSTPPPVLVSHQRNSAHPQHLHWHQHPCHTGETCS